MKIIILDDHKLFGESLKRILLDNIAVERCDYVSSEKSLFQALQLETYDIVLLDINLKNAAIGTGFDVLVRIKECFGSQKVVVLSSYNMPLYEKKAYENGAVDFVNKSIEIGDLIIRLKKTLIGKKIKVDDYVDCLTDREIEILKELCTGKIKKEIAKKLFISERTLYNHIQNIYDKLGATNAVEAFNKAIEQGYLEPLM